MRPRKPISTKTLAPITLNTLVAQFRRTHHRVMDAIRERDCNAVRAALKDRKHILVGHQQRLDVRSIRADSDLLDEIS